MTTMCCLSRRCCLCFLLLLAILLVGFVFGFGVLAHGFNKFRDALNLRSFRYPTYSRPVGPSSRHHPLSIDHYDECYFFWLPPSVNSSESDGKLVSIGRL
ncbi:hypothetical protein ZIOFF_021637 [Zingiber officinale]|uniref:Uncharacterized protein n=1 Tax=Zingiber officinale TaxID=94328 RepID=A0A8J5H1Q9_ZINOF|nr:hypothetical protein ZIOFF_021637 [Zingiber officinale]